MKQFKYEVIYDKKVILTQQGNWEALKMVKEFVTKRMSASFALSVFANNKLVVSKSEEHPTWSGGIGETIKDRMFDALWQSAFGQRQFYNMNVGEKGKSTFTLCGIGLTWECTSNRAPARPKHVIAAEKAKRAAKSQARQEQRAKWQAEADQRTSNLRKRIQQQVDHAFATGKSGTEPASMYITCQHCDGPAAVVCLNQPLAPGAMALDEDTIVGALCTAHIQYQPWGYYSRYSGKEVHKVPCSKLEFFYDGIRQIAVKP